MQKIINFLLRYLGLKIQITKLHNKSTTNISNTPSSTKEKHSFIKSISNQNNFENFVETGTYLGNLIYSIKEDFKCIFTIELSEELALNAQQKFEKYSNINVIHGDSGKELAKIIPLLDTKTIFWLDGHFSGGITARGEKDAPVFEELESIFKSINAGLRHLILIDDARLFLNKTLYTGYLRYPEIENWVQKDLKGYKIQVMNDIIVIGDENLDI